MQERIKKLITHGEKINIEYKAAQRGLPRSIYETVCAFLNTKGGEILLGVDDDRNIIGVKPEHIDTFKKNFTSEINNPQKINPTVYLSMEDIKIDGKTILYVNVPEGSQVYKCDNKIYLRNHEGDYDISNNQTLVATLFTRKITSYSENQIFPYITMEDLNQDVINKVRKMAVLRNKNHPWANMDNLELLKSASLHLKDYSNQQEGFTLACALLFGKDLLIQNVLPHYRTDLILKRENVDRYDDRDTVQTNLIDSYDRIMAFVEKHLPSPFKEDEKGVRIDIRNAIFSELAVNSLMHREFSSHFYARFIIEKDKIVIENGNKPFVCGNIKPDDFRPYTKNPTIAKVFKEIGYAEELGSGIRNIMKYSKEYFGNNPEFVDDTLFITTLKYSPEKLKDQDTGTVSGIVGGIDSGIVDDKSILEFCETPKSVIEIMRFFGYSKKSYFLKNKITPLMERGLLKQTIPDKPTSKNQKYVVIK